MTASDKMSRIDHVMLPVADIERAIAFYSDAFGMAVIERRDDGDRRFAHVGYGPRGEHVTIELIEQRNVAVIVGNGHFCLRLPELSEWVATRELAGQVFAKPHGLHDGRILRAWIRDSDGHLVEVADVAS